MDRPPDAPADCAAADGRTNPDRDKVSISMILHQDPSPDRRLLNSRGDTLVFTLRLPHPLEGRAWLRSNMGHAGTMREEIIRQAEADETPLHRDWYDRPMTQVDPTTFRVVVPLREVGHFEAKCYFLERERCTPIWPAGANTVINVEPAANCAANIIYNAFVRQFGPNKDGKVGNQWRQTAVAELDRQQFTVIPPSGTFRDLIEHLDFIIHELGCTIVQLLPIHPTPTTYARMGRFGSPYAALSFLDVDPALARFDPAATPLEQFGELVDAVHARKARLFLDIAINHTGWAARMHGLHPEWLARDEKGRIEVPGAWGVQWEDLTRLDYRHKALWRFMADMFLTWCRRGVDGFRCDAGYMIPQPAWRYMVAKVRREFPETVFLLEGLGGKLVVTRDLLNRANFNWAYSELFQNYDRHQIEGYLPDALDISATDGLTVHFAETHDNPRLAARSQTWSRMRTALCALFAPQGAFGFANGVEWFATEKINVHDSPSLNWGAESNQVAAIRRLTDLLKHHSCFHDHTHLELVQTDGGNTAVLLRHHRPSDQRLLVAANLDENAPSTASWPASAAAGWPPNGITDLLTGRRVPLREQNGLYRCDLAPGEVLCLAASDPLAQPIPPGSGAVPRVDHQRRRAKVLDLAALWNGERCDDLDIDTLAHMLWKDPLALCRRLRPVGSEPGVTLWEWPRDRRRDVMLPPGHVLLVDAPHAFQARIVLGDDVLAVDNALATADGRHAALLTPRRTAVATLTAVLEIRLFRPGQTERARTTVQLLGDALQTRPRRVWPRRAMPEAPLTWLGTNGRGAMTHMPIRWATLESRYDAVLAANLHPEVPEDRWIMLTRLRAWAVFQGYSQEIRHDCLETFHEDGHQSAVWHFRVPTGQGQSIRLVVRVQLLQGRNAVRLVFERRPAAEIHDALPDALPVRLIVRPDIEDRNFHATTKAYLGPETHFASAVSTRGNGFDFRPDQGRRLCVTATPGSYVHEPEWHYMVHRPLEAERGLDAASDLFSPGYFSADLPGGERMLVNADLATGADAGDAVCQVPPETEQPADPPATYGETAAFLKKAMAQFIVKRGAFATVIAGYPWFLDWGRDTLIFCRGMIAAGMTDTAADIIRQFAAFEHEGTLPNMIRGNDATNRDTSDAPLWLFTACRDMIRRGRSDILDMACGRRRLVDVLVDLAAALCRGTPNGIVMDTDSGLLFSPAHFTWMDTNHPAGSPRQGYPIEIQALWHAALQLLAEIGAPDKGLAWDRLADQVQASIGRLFFDDRLGYLADCRHGPQGQSAADCPADDALRPNQLFAVTLGALGDPHQVARIVSACQALLVPGAIRSLADRPVKYPLPVHHGGRLLNDPRHPYQGHYRGDEDTQRKPAYHNGTAWTWVFPSYCEALAAAYGESGRQTARSLLATAVALMNGGCLGHIPEILDGDAPHRPRGCDAQAWSVSEVYRVWRLLAEGDGKGMA
jgi:predicted glycogen debranching enzyme